MPIIAALRRYKSKDGYISKKSEPINRIKNKTKTTTEALSIHISRDFT